MYLGTQKIKEVKPTDRVTPLGVPVSEVVFLSQLELTHEAIDEVRERQEAVKTEPETPESIAKLAELEKEEERITQNQLTDSDVNEAAYISQNTLDKFQTEEPDQSYYEKRKHLIVGELLKVMADWNLQAIEIGQVLQNLQDSFNQNQNKAFETALGRSIKNLNMLDIHYVLTGTDRKNA